MIYVVSDLHGYPLEKFEKLLDRAGFTEDDFLYVLGDVIDRGKDGVKILQWLMCRDNASLILGNHEAMLLACDFLFEEITDESIDRLTGDNLDSYMAWVENDGQPTIDALAAVDKSERQYILEYLRASPLCEVVTVNDRDFILTHSGLGGFRPDKKLREYTDYELLWARPKSTQKYFDGVTVVFGHTPTLCFGAEYAGRAFKTDTWIDIDAGAGYGLTPMLLRLDDMREIYF